MLKKYIQHLIKHGAVKRNVLINQTSFYNKIKEDVKHYPTLALFYLNAHYQYHVERNAILLSYRLYKELRARQIKIDISSHKPYEFYKFMNEIQERYIQEISPPNFILNNIEPFKSILVESKYIAIACLRLNKENKYIDDFKTMSFFSSPRWCIRTKNQFYSYSQEKNSIQYVIISKNVFGTHKENLRKLTTNTLNDYNHRIGITLKRDKKLRAKTGIFGFLILNTKIICHDDQNGSISYLNDFRERTDNFPIHKIHNKLIRIIKKGKILDIPKYNESEKYIEELEHLLDQQQYSQYRTYRQEYSHMSHAESILTDRGLIG